MSVASLLWRSRAALVATFAIGLVAASPAAAATAVNPLGCAPTQDLHVPLWSFGDDNLYATAPGGTFEAGTTAGWTLGAGASLVAGNEPWGVLGANHGSSLRLAPNAVATSAPMCVDETFPNFRFFARNLGKVKSQLEVKVLFMDVKGNIKSAKSGTLSSTGSSWQLVTPFKIGITIDPTATNAAAPIAFQFKASKDSDWRIDNLVVDPYRRG